MEAGKRTKRFVETNKKKPDIANRWEIKRRELYERGGISIKEERRKKVGVSIE